MTSKKTNLVIENKVNDLLNGMTLDEKLAQLSSYWMYDLQSAGVLDEQKVSKNLKNGIGQITRVGGASTYLPREAARISNKLQYFLKDKTRLGIPAIVHEECCVGLMAPGASVFPEIIGLASTFRPELARKMTSIIRQQVMAIGARQGLAPVLDVARDPRWGRVEETFGEDPLLVSQFGVEYIKGLQTDDIRDGVMATGKHFVGHSFSQGGLNCAPIHLGWREIWEVYLAPFQAAIRDANIATMMNAYPEIDGEVVAASNRILTTLLRESLGFTGLVVSDYDAVIMLHNYHYVAKDRKQAAVKALEAGIDVELPTITCYGEDLKQAIEAGQISIELVDQSVKRHLTKKFELGLFENPFVNEDRAIELFDTAEQRALAYEIACQSMVLLKNDGTLPINPKGLTIGLIGPNANSSRCMFGDYSYAAVTELLKVLPDENSAFQTLTEDEAQKLFPLTPTLLEALRKKYPENEILFAEGCGIKSDDESGFPKAVEVALSADIIILALGGRSGLAPYCTTGEFRDSTDLSLPGVQEKLAHLITDLGKPVVIVNLNGRPTAFGELSDKVNAILQAWVPGEEGGRAIVATLMGEVNPGGRLPISIPHSGGQVPVYYNHKPSGMKSNIYGDYANQKVTPLYPFGHGLSYSQFEYSNLILSSNKVEAGDIVTISIDVTNVSQVAGEEVVQLYCRDQFASVPRPVKELKGFVRIRLEPNQTRKVVFKLPVNILAFYDLNLDLIVEPGDIDVMIGSSSEDIRLTSHFEIIGDDKSILQERIFVCPVETNS